jgi:putative pyoverdin transport system ATP-binding/permease protein
VKNLARLLAFLARSEKGRHLTVVMLAIYSAVAGLASTALLAVINIGLGRAQARTTTLALTFAGLCVVLPVARYFSQFLLARLSEDLAFDLRLRLSERILQVPLRQLESLGPGRLLAVLTGDIATITELLSAVPLLCLHITIVSSCLVYLGWLSWKLLVVVLAAVAIGVLGYSLPMAASNRYFTLARDQGDALAGHFRGLIEGTKELKLHRARRRDFLESVLRRTAAAMRDHTLRSRRIFALASSAGQVLFFVVIGLVLFVLPGPLGVAEKSLAPFILTVLYMLTPLDIIVNVLPNLSHALVSIGKIDELGVTLAASATDEGKAGIMADASPAWRELSLHGASHTFYRENRDDSFTLGPLDLSLHRGEVVFLIGGNGSGKTTLAKLLIGLYVPEHGELRLDGTLIDDANRDSYRQLFSVVFSDFFLFDSLLGLAGPQLDADARRYLAELHLDRKVRLVDGALSTLALSQGQRKRLALLTAYLEDRQIYLFDEWAADQDPLFKRIFYLQIVPELKRRGKTVVVISHDEPYFHAADRIVKLDHGQLDPSAPAGHPFPAAAPPAAPLEASAPLQQ